MLNWDIMKHPMNWIIVILMLIIASIAVDLVLRSVGAKPASAE